MKFGEFAEYEPERSWLSVRKLWLELVHLQLAGTGTVTGRGVYFPLSAL